MSESDVARGASGRKVVFSAWVWALLLFLLALVPRVPGLRLFLTTDEPYFLQQSVDVIDAFLGNDFQGTYWHFYPGVTINWLMGLGLGSQWLFTRLTEPSSPVFNTGTNRFVAENILDLVVAVRLPYVLLTAGGLAGFYLLARRLLGHWTATLGALFIAFDPFFLAHSRVAHGDAPVTVFMGISALAFLVYVRGPAEQTSGIGDWGLRKRRWLVLSALMAALAALTKPPGQFMVLFVVLVAVGDWLLRSWHVGHLDWRLAGRWLLDVGLWGGVAALLFVALWPAMWADPVGTVARMLNETFGKVEAGHLVFFMGRPTLDPGPWFYPYVIAFRLTPITLMGVIISVVLVLTRGIALVGKGPEVSWGPEASGNQRSLWPSRYTVAVLLWLYVISLLLFGTLSPKKQDRYLLPLFPFLDLLAAFAYVEVVQIVESRIRSGPRRWTDRHNVFRNTQCALCVAVPLVLVFAHVLPVATSYPYYLAYFNPLMGGLPRAIQTTLVGWGEGMEQAAAYFNQRSDAEQLFVAAVPSQTFLPYFDGTGENLYTNDVALRADYVILYVSQVQRLAPSPEIVRHFLSTEPEYTVFVLDVPYAWIYPSPKLITSQVAPEATVTDIGFGDQLRLAGYQISNPGFTASSQEVVLYWHVLSPMADDYTISVRLIAPDGTWLAQHDGWPGAGLLPTSQLRPGDYVKDIHTLEVPPGAVVEGVQVVVYDAESGQTLGVPTDLAGEPPE